MWAISLLLIATSYQVKAQTIPSSVTVSGACLGGTYTLTKVADNYDMTGRPAYSGSGTVTVGTTTAQTNIAVFYQASGSDPAPAWVLAFSGQPYQYSKSTAALPPMTGYTAVTDQSIGTCSGSAPLTVNYAVPAVRVALSAASVCSGSPFSVTATATNFSSPATSYTLSASSTDLTRTNSTGVFTVNAPSVSSTTTYTLTVSAANSTERASTTTVITVNPTPTLVLSLNGSANPTRCDTPNGQIAVATNLPNGNYSLSYRRNATNPQTASVVVTSGLFSITGLSGGSYYNLSISTNGCTGVSNTTITLTNPTPPTVSITPSSTAICAGQSVQLTASGASTYAWSTGATTASILATATAVYSVTGTTSNGCTGIASATVIVNQPPTVAITGLASAYCQNAGTQALNGSPTGGVFTIDGNVATTFTPSSLSVGQHTVTYSFTNTSGCSNAVSQTVTVNPVPIVALSGLASAYCQSASSVPLSGAPTGGQFTIDGQTATSFNPASLSVGQHTVVYSYTNSIGCANSVRQIVTVNPLPVVAITGLATTYCQNASSVALTGSPAGGQFTINGQAATSFNPTSLLVGQYTVVYSFTNSSGCSNAVSQTVTVNPVPVVAITGLASTYCQNASAQTLGGSPTGGSFTIDGQSATSFTPASLSVGQHTVVYAYTNSSGCANSTSQSLTINPVSVVAITGLASAYCQDAANITLSGSPAGGQFTLDGALATTANPASLSVGQHTVVYSYTNSSGCANSVSQSFSIKPTPPAPTIVTTSGQPYPAGVSSVTVSQNTGSIILAVSGCAGGTITWNGGSANTLSVSTANLGTQTFQATCTVDGCTSPAGTATVSVVPATLGVLYRDADYGNTGNNIIKPYLELSNASNEPIPYGEVTVRYWFTSDGGGAPTNLAVYYAQLGAVNMKYVALSQPRQGANGYVEYSFPGGGILAAQSVSGPIENGVQKTDGSNFNESDDYSYQANYQDYLPNARITAYRNGQLFWGVEPTAITSQTAVAVYSQAKDGTTTSQIQTRLELRNTGNTALAVADLRLRYYFTSDNNQTASVYVDYADIGAANVQARVVKLPAPVGGADSYVELQTVPNSYSLSPGSSLGAIDFRLVRSDNGIFDQSNDYSYAPNYGNVGLNNHVTVLLNNRLIFGTPPSGAPARSVAQEPSAVLQARVLGNPVIGSQAIIEIKGAEGKAVEMQLVDLQGRLVHSQRLEQAGVIDQVNVPLGQSRGTLLLKVSTTDQQQQLKVLRP